VLAKVTVVKIVKIAQINTLPDDGVTVTPKHIGAVLM